MTSMSTLELFIFLLTMVFALCLIWCVYCITQHDE